MRSGYLKAIENTMERQKNFWENITFIFIFFVIFKIIKFLFH